MIRIRQLAGTDRWQAFQDVDPALAVDGDYITASAALRSIGDVRATYAECLDDVSLYASALVSIQAAAGEVDPSDGMLPTGWLTDSGVAFAELTGDGRDFTEVVWSWRDPAVSLVPLMFQTETEVGHFGAVLAGFVENVATGAGNRVDMDGRFYATDEGRNATTVLADGRRFGVSVDAAEVDVEFICTAEDEEGWCIDGVARFLAYRIAGLTMTPFPAFERATIMLAAEPADAGSDTEDTAPAMVASGGIGAPAPTRPRRDWFHTPEPQLGAEFDLGGIGDEWLVAQNDDAGDGAVLYGMPLHITDDRRVLGHLALWGQCHVGYIDECVSPPASSCGYGRFHVGATICDDGTTLATGTLTSNCDHAASRLRAPEAMDHYAHNGLGWADGRVIDGVHGPWFSGYLRSDVTDLHADLYRAGALSGDWRRIDGELEMIAALAVSTPGFPIIRERSLVASAGVRLGQRQGLTVHTVSGQIDALVASGVVRRCPDCARAAAAGRMTTGGAITEAQAARIERTLATIERRTRHLVSAEAAHIASTLNLK